MVSLINAAMEGKQTLRPKQAQPWLYDNDDPYSIYQAAMMQQRAGITRRFDEYYRCYPVVMLPGPERESSNHGGKVFLPASALEKLTRLHISYPMLFELINGAKDKQTHAGVLEFTAEEGKIYLPYWVSRSPAAQEELQYLHHHLAYANTPLRGRRPCTDQVHRSTPRHIY